MTSLSYPPRPIPYEEDRESPLDRARGERRASKRSDPFGGQYTPDPFAPKSPKGRLPKVDPLMPTKQAEALKRQWEEKKAIEEAQRRAYEHKRRLAQEEAQRRAEAYARERSERLAREKAELDYQRWESRQRELEEQQERARQSHLAMQMERERRRREEEERARLEEQRLVEWRQEQLYAREQKILESQRLAQQGAEARRRSGSFIPPPDARRVAPPSAPPYGMSPSFTQAQNEPHMLAARSYPEQSFSAEHSRAPSPVNEALMEEEKAQREAELLRLVKLQVETITQLKSSLNELSARQQLLERRQASSERAERALRQPSPDEARVSSATQERSDQPSAHPKLGVEPAVEPAIEPAEPAVEPAEPAAEPAAAPSPPPPSPAARLSSVHNELYELSRPKGIFARLTSGLRKIVGTLDEDPLSELNFTVPGVTPMNLPPARQQGDEASSDERPTPITFNQTSSTEEAHKEERPSPDQDLKPESDRDVERGEGPQASAYVPQFSQGAFEQTVGGVTVSRSPQLGQDGPLYPILLQQAQLIKQHSMTIETLGRRVKQLESSLKAQSADLRAQLKGLTKQVDRAEVKADGVQRYKGRVKSHQRRISQLEVMIEGLEGKLATFEERLNSGSNGPATDLRVAPEPGVGDYTSIQAAINDAPVGAYIGIMPGLYDEPLEITKPVKLIGLGRPNDVLIQVPEFSAISINRIGGQYEEAISHTQELAARKRLQEHTSHLAEPSRRGGLFRWFKQRLLNEPEVDDRGLFEVETGNDEVSIVGISINSVTAEVGGTPTDHPTISVRSGHLRLEKCEVRAENGVGVIAEGENAKVTLRACHILNTRGAGLRLRTRAVATLSGTRVMKSKENGIDAQGFTSVRLMDCEISNNQRIGVHAGFKSQLIAYQCVISGNSFEGVWMNNQSSGSIRSCDMRGNARGPYDISPDCKVELNGNKP